MRHRPLPKEKQGGRDLSDNCPSEASLCYGSFGEAQRATFCYKGRKISLLPREIAFLWSDLEPPCQVPLASPVLHLGWWL